MRLPLLLIVVAAMAPVSPCWPADDRGSSTAIGKPAEADVETTVNKLCDEVAGPPQGIRGKSGRRLPAKTRAVFDVCFDGEWKLQSPEVSRITNKDDVWIRVRHFNFLRYTITYDVKEEKSESYQYLTKLWSSVLNPELSTIIGALGEDRANKHDTQVVPFLRMADRVYVAARQLEKAIKSNLERFDQPGLSASEVGELKTASDNVAKLQKNLEDAYGALESAVEGTDCRISVPDTVPDKDASPNPLCFELAYGSAARYYKLARDSYNLAKAKADSFLKLAEKTRSDEIKKLGTRDAGTRVTVTATSIDESGAKADIQAIHYAVQSTMPLVAHGGIVLSGLKDVSFDTVKRATSFGDNDFFAQRGNGDNTKGFSVFLAWQFYGAGSSTDTDTKSHPVALMLSLGTDVTAPGRRLFVGPSVMLFGRVVLTGGPAFGRESTGQEPIEPNVFKLISERPKSTWFAALSMRVF